MEANILVVEDEKGIRDAITIYLKNQGYHVYEVENGVQGLEMVENHTIHLAIVDIMMPVMDGITMTMKLREKYDFPLIFLSAKSEDIDKITGLNIGADDYISKPFSIREVIARVKAVLRRIVDKEDPAILQFEKLYIDPVKKRAFIDSTELPLTKKEFEILSLLLSHPGQVFSREEILSKIWTDEVYVLDRTIDVNITRLRKKIGEYGKRIVTRLGYGYCFETA